MCRHMVTDKKEGKKENIRRTLNMMFTFFELGGGVGGRDLAVRGLGDACGRGSALHGRSSRAVFFVS